MPRGYTTPTGVGFERGTKPSERRDFFDIRRLTAGIGKKMEWAGTWQGGRYDYNDVVLDDGWTMVCRVEEGCTDKPAPYPSGSPFFLYGGADPTRQDLAKQILFGNRYTFSQGGFLTGWRIWTVAGNRYTVYSVYDPDGAAELTELVSFTGAGGWENFGLNSTIVYSGTVFELLAIVQEPDPTPTTFTGSWNYTTPPQNAVPLVGTIIHSNDQPDSFRISTTDFNSGDRRAELLGLDVGDTINGTNISWAIQNVVDNATWFDFTVAPAVQDIPDGVASFTFETVSPTPVTTLEDPAYWPTTPHTVQGVFGIDGATPTLNTNAYGTDIQLQLATVSDEWELVAGGGGGGSSGSAGVAISARGTHVDFYEFAKTVDVLDIPETWTQVGVLDLVLPTSGVYELGASATWQFSSTAKSVYTRWRINGGAWNERVQEPKDAGDIYTNYYAYPAFQDAGVFLVELEMRKEDATGTLDLQFLDLFMERKK